MHSKQHLITDVACFRHAGDPQSCNVRPPGASCWKGAPTSAAPPLSAAHLSGTRGCSKVIARSCSYKSQKWRHGCSSSLSLYSVSWLPAPSFNHAPFRSPCYRALAVSSPRDRPRRSGRDPWGDKGHVTFTARTEVTFNHVMTARYGDNNQCHSRGTGSAAEVQRDGFSISDMVSPCQWNGRAFLALLCVAVESICIAGGSFLPAGASVWFCHPCADLWNAPL